MSTELKSSNPEITLTRFYGGEDRGTCLHISLVSRLSKKVSSPFLRPQGNISIRRDQAARLAADLLSFARCWEEEQNMPIEQLETLLESTRRKLTKQEAMIGKSIQSADPELYETERELEQALANARDDAPVTLQDLLTEYRAPEDTPPLAPAVMKLLNPEEQD